MEAVREVMEGQKTEHRILLDPQPRYAALTASGLLTSDRPITPDRMEMSDMALYAHTPWERMPYRRAQVLYVREAHRIIEARVYRTAGEGQGLVQTARGVQYRTDETCFFPGGFVPPQDSAYRTEVHAISRWLPATCMPERLSRILVRLNDVRVERLQEIGFEGCKAEGIWDDYKALSQKHHDTLAQQAYRVTYAAWWDSRIAKKDLPRRGWAADPWVYVLSFERAYEGLGHNTLECEVIPFGSP